MALHTPVPVLIRSRDRRENESTPGWINRIEYDRKDRMKNAFRNLGIWIALAFGSILIPFWHFFLVPTCLILAYTLTLRKWGETFRNAGGEGTCPDCAAQLRIEPSLWKDRLVETCGKCFHSLEITPRT
jgi:hypothetical protein